MFIDEIDVNDLSVNPEEAFITFEQRLRKALEVEMDTDRRRNTDSDGEYYGSFTPERYYVSSVLAFLDECDLDIDISDISGLDNRDFPQHFGRFFTEVNYAKTRFVIRKQRVETGATGTAVLIAANYKEEIGNYLQTIRKIVNQEISDQNKKDAIFKKIAALQSEVDRDRTTYDALLGNVVELSKALGDCAENLEPAVQKVERIFNAITKAVERIPLLPRKERPKLISAPKDETAQTFDGEIPF